ncbi:MAG: CRISPR-associated protein Csx20 [bacterium]
MKKLHLIFSHKLTEEQKEDACQALKVESFLYLPENLQKIWSNIDPAGSLDKNSLNIVCKWIENNGAKGDFVLVQGDFGATTYLVSFCFKKEFVPIYATTKRVSQEKQNVDGTVERKQLFKHVGFRKYELFKEE